MDWHILIFVLPFSSTSPQVCRGWNQAFHLPELWRCFEFELNQPASSYLKATHPDLIKQIIKRHSNHLQYVSFKVWSDLMTMTWSSTHSNNRIFFFKKRKFHLLCSLKVDSSRESAEAACDILSQLVNCSLKTLGLISTARPSFMEVPKVSTVQKAFITNAKCYNLLIVKVVWHHKIELYYIIIIIK